jgi:hypothetical protein
MGVEHYKSTNQDKIYSISTSFANYNDLKNQELFEKVFQND